MTADIEKLKALALAATAGPWAMATDWDRAAVYSETHMVPRYKDEPINKRVVCSGNQNNMGRSGQEHWSGADWADAKYIAAANPAAVLELIADNERLKIENANLQHAFTLATAPDSHVIPPPRGTGSQQEASDALLSACRKGVVALAHAAGNPMYMGAYEALSSAIETEVARRGRAQGGITSENSRDQNNAKTSETRMGTGFEGGPSGSGGAAGTDKDANCTHPFRTGNVWELAQGGGRCSTCGQSILTPGPSGSYCCKCGCPPTRSRKGETK